MKDFIHFLKHNIRNPEFRRVLALRTVGNLLVLASLFMIGKTLLEPAKAEARYFIDQRLGKQYVIASQEDAAELDSISNTRKGSLANLLKIKRVEPLVPQDTNFGIVIPKIAANANVIADVNAGDQAEYLEALQRGVAHANGTAKPGQGEKIYLFSHSTDYFYNVTRYNAIFYLLYKLEPGDEINLFYKGARYKYLVDELKIVNPSEVGYLTEKSGREELVLQTCWPLGTTFQRLLVFARPASEIAQN